MIVPMTFISCMMLLTEESWHVLLSVPVDENGKVVGMDFLKNKNTKAYQSLSLDNEIVGKYYSTTVDRYRYRTHEDVMNSLLNQNAPLNTEENNIKKLSRTSLLNIGDKGTGKIFVPIVSQIEDRINTYRIKIILLRYHYLAKYFTFDESDVSELRSLGYSYDGIGRFNSRPVDKWIKQYEISSRSTVDEAVDITVREESVLFQFSFNVKDKNVLKVLESSL